MIWLERWLPCLQERGLHVGPKTRYPFPPHPEGAVVPIWHPVRMHIFCPRLLIFDLLSYIYFDFHLFPVFFPLVPLCQFFFLSPPTWPRLIVSLPAGTVVWRKRTSRTSSRSSVYFTPNPSPNQSPLSEHDDEEEKEQLHGEAGKDFCCRKGWLIPPLLQQRERIFMRTTWCCC
jgi:hypothetical protein